MDLNHDLCVVSGGSENILTSISHFSQLELCLAGLGKAIILVVPTSLDCG